MRFVAYILGTTYIINFVDRIEPINGVDINGDIDFKLKEIKILKDAPFIENVIRHELIHAFLFESGLSANNWLENEEMIQWFAMQMPKILSVEDVVLGNYYEIV